VTDREKTSSGPVPVLVIHSARPLIVFQVDQSHRSIRNELWTLEVDVVSEIVVLAIVVFVDVVTTVVVELLNVVGFPLVELVTTVVVVFEIKPPEVEVFVNALNVVEV